MPGMAPLLNAGGLTVTGRIDPSPSTVQVLKGAGGLKAKPSYTHVLISSGDPVEEEDFYFKRPRQTQQP